MTEEDLTADRPAAPGALSALRDASYEGRPLQDSMATLSSTPILDPSNQWRAYAAGALRPATGGFGESLGNALGAQAEQSQKESELKARYIPLMAQALLQRQLQAQQLAINRWKLNQNMDLAGTGALTALLHRPEPLTGAHVVSVLGSAMQRGQITQDKARELYAGLGNAVNDPEALRAAIHDMSLARMNPEAAQKAVMPDVSVEDLGGVKTPVNKNTQAGAVPVGALPGTLSKTLTPAEALPKIDKDANGNTILVDPVARTSAFPTPVANAAPGAVEGTPAAPKVSTPAGKAADEAGGKDMADYSAKLNTRVTSMRDAQQRFQEMRDLIKGFRGGASAEMRAKLGAWVNDLSQTLGLSPEQAKKISNGLSSEKDAAFSNAQAFQKLATVGAMEALTGAMNSGRITQGEFGVFKANSPSITMDPAALDKMLNFTTRQYMLAGAEQAEYDKYRKTHADTLGFPAYWNQYAQDTGLIQPVQATGTGRGSAAAPHVTPITSEKVEGVSTKGRKLRMGADGGFYEVP